MAFMKNTLVSLKKVENYTLISGGIPLGGGGWLIIAIIYGSVGELEEYKGSKIKFVTFRYMASA